MVKGDSLPVSKLATMKGAEDRKGGGVANISQDSCKKSSRGSRMQYPGGCPYLGASKTLKGETGGFQDHPGHSLPSLRTGRVNFRVLGDAGGVYNHCSDGEARALNLRYSITEREPINSREET